MASSVKVGVNVSAVELFIRLRCHDLILLSAENERSALAFCYKFSRKSGIGGGAPPCPLVIWKPGLED